MEVNFTTVYSVRSRVFFDVRRDLFVEEYVGKVGGYSTRGFFVHVRVHGFESTSCSIVRCSILSLSLPPLLLRCVFASHTGTPRHEVRYPGRSTLLRTLLSGITSIYTTATTTACSLLATVVGRFIVGVIQPRGPFFITRIVLLLNMNTLLGFIQARGVALLRPSSLAPHRRPRHRPPRSHSYHSGRLFSCL